MSSSPAYYLHLSNENNVTADTDTPSEHQEPLSLSSINDTELDAFEKSCNDDADFNDFLNNIVQGKNHSDVHDALVEEAMAHEHEKLCSTTTTATNSKWDDNWQQKFGQLQSFKRDNGHIHVPISNENTRSLGFWLDRQKKFVRQYYKSTSTSNEVESYKRRRRYELLLSIGLTPLGAHDMAWEMSFGELLAYRSEHHTCNVPTKGTNLGRWVSKMRKQYKTYHFRKEKPDGWDDKMENRYHRLKEAGFVFCAAEKKVTRGKL